MQPIKHCPYCDTLLHAFDHRCERCNYIFKEKKLFSVPANTRMLKVSYSDGSIYNAICYNLVITKEVLYVDLWDKYSNEPIHKSSKFIELQTGRYAEILHGIANLKIEYTYQSGISQLIGGDEIVLTFVGNNNEELLTLTPDFINGKEICLITYPKKYDITDALKRLIPELETTVKEFRSVIQSKNDLTNQYKHSTDYQEENYSFGQRIKKFFNNYNINKYNN